MMFWCQLLTSTMVRFGSTNVIRRPTAVVVPAPGTLLAAIIQQASPDILPDGVLTVESHGVGGLDFHDPITATARYAQYVPRDFRKAAVQDRYWLGLSSRITQDSVPMRVRDRLKDCRCPSRSFSLSLGSHLFELFRCRHSPARRSIAHSPIRTEEERMSSLILRTWLVRTLDRIPSVK